MRKGSTIWTPEKIEALQELWPTHSASEIARELGTTRNAVLGKKDRLRGNGKMLNILSRPARKVNPRPPAKPSNRKPPQHPESKSPPNSTVRCPLQLVELEAINCKWPIGDPKRAPDEFHFCGAPRQMPFPYCSEHVSMAFQPRADDVQQSREVIDAKPRAMPSEPVPAYRRTIRIVDAIIRTHADGDHDVPAFAFWIAHQTRDAVVVTRYFRDRGGPTSLR
jgi:hypothetical protein